MRFWTAVGPADCALAVGIPLDWSEFLRQAADPAYHFARFVVENAGGHAEAVRRAYEERARLVQHVCTAAERLGVHVARGVRLADLASIFSRNVQVATIVAHWRMLTVKPEDVLDPHALVATLDADGSEHPCQVALRAAWHDAARRSPGEAVHAGLPVALARAEVARRLRRYVESANAFYLPPDVRRVEPDLRWKELTRAGLESVLSASLLARGRFIELADGLHTLPEFVSAVPPAFGGVLDLTICHSAFAFETIKAARPNCLLVANRYPARIEQRMVRYKLLVKLLADEPRPFIPLVTRLHGELGGHDAELARSP